jgi:homoserine O-succinyltransferase/O-acetyltransferase
MPVIIHSKEIHPFLPSLGSPLAIDRTRAEQQDIRPLEIAIINLMADKISTERQLALWLGNTMLQVNLTFVATDSYLRAVAAGRHSKNTPTDHIHKFYSAFSDISDKKFDGFIVTGVNALRDRVEQEAFWPEVTDILQWTTTNAFSSLFLCWGAKAALKFFHDINSYKGERKLFGLFEHRLISDKTGLLFGFPDAFAAPVSRWKSPRREDILKVPAIEIVADSEEAGPNMLVESEPLDDNSALFPRRVYILNHPEYETHTLGAEYHRDSAIDPDYPLPRHYFPGDDPSRAAPNLWRHTAHVYTNWVKAVYASTPYAIKAIPHPSKVAEAAQARSEVFVGS